MGRIRKTVFIVSSVICIISAACVVYQLIDDYRSKSLTDNLASIHQDLITEATVAEVTESVTSVLTEYVEESLIYVTAEEAAESVEIVETAVETQEIAASEPHRLVIQDSMKPFYDLNHDTAGWLTVVGTEIDNIVVQATDNSFYLDHDFDKNSSQSGTLFADYRCNINSFGDWQSNVLTIYGHNQMIGTMFGTLDNYKNDIDFYKEHPTFTFSNLYEDYVYKIVGMFVCKTAKTPGVESTELFSYHDFIDFKESGRYTFQNWVENIRNRSQVETNVDMLPDDKYIVLSTCSYEFSNARFVVVGRRVRAGESPDVDTSKAVLNDNPLI